MSTPLLPRVALGDENAVNEFLEEYGGLVWSLAKRMCRLNADAEDATQEIFLEIWKNAAKFDPKLSSEPTFVTMIARRKLIDRLRKSSRRPDLVGIDNEVAPAEEEQTDYVEIAEEAAIAKECLLQLRSDERKIIELSIFQQFSQSKIAKVMDLPLGTVKTHARRGMLRLRELLTRQSVAAGGVS